MRRHTPRRVSLVAAVAVAAMAVEGLLPAAGDEPEIPDYEPTFESLSRHPTPGWFDNAKFGIFLHWGPYSVPAWRDGSEWYWRYWVVPDQFPGNLDYHRETYGEDFPYDRFAEQWTAENYDPESWVKLFEDAGARYFVLTAKHHDGWALWDTHTTDRDTVAYGPHRDLVGELFDAAGDSSLKTGLYYSLIEWFHPNEGQLRNGPTNPYTGEPIPYLGYRPIDDYVMDHQYPQLLELVDEYDPDLIWCDIPSRNNSNAFMAHYFNQAKNRPDPKEVAVNDRCGNGISDYTTFEKSAAPTIRAAKWESEQVIDDHWGWGYVDGVQVRDSTDLIHQLIDVVSKNGNLLLNIGPKADGTIADRHRRALLDIGAWLDLNGEAIYGTTYWAHAEDPRSNVPVRYTVKNDALYAVAMAWPGESLRLSPDLPLDQSSTIRLLGSDGKPLPWERDADGVTVAMPEGGPDATASEHAYAFKITTPGVRQVMRNVLTAPETVDAGESFTATLAVTNPARTTSPDGRLTLDVPDGWSVAPSRVTITGLAPGESRDIEFEVTPPAATAPARHVLTAYADFGRIRYQSEARLLVGIAGFRNVAVGKPAAQKSTAYGGVAGRAVDGDTDGNWGNGSVTHTAEPENQAWWQVDLGERVEISDIALWNRTDCCADRLSHYYVLVSDEPFRSDDLDDVLAQPGVTSFHQINTAGRPTRFPVDTAGRYVRVQLASATNPLSLAEVEILTPIPSG